MPDDASTQLQLWIDRLQAGDPAARDALISHACDRLRRLTRTMLKDFRRLRQWEETDDVLNTAVLRLMRALDDTRPDSVAEFFRLAALQIRRQLLDLSRQYYGPEGSAARRAAPAAGAADSSTPVAEGPDSTYNPERLAWWTDFHERVEALPPEERDVFELVWYQGLSQEEAARVLNVPYGTVKRRWLAARLRLQEVLGEDGPA